MAQQVDLEILLQYRADISTCESRSVCYIISAHRDYRINAGDVDGLMRRSGVEGDIAVGQGQCGLGLFVGKGASKGEVRATIGDTYE